MAYDPKKVSAFSSQAEAVSSLNSSAKPKSSTKTTTPAPKETKKASSNKSANGAVPNAQGLINIPGRSIYETNTPAQIAAAGLPARPPAVGSVQTVAQYQAGLQKPVITPDAMTEEVPMPIATPTQVPAFDVNNIPVIQPTNQEIKASAVTDQVIGLNDQLLGKSAYQAKQEAKYGVSAAITTFNDLAAQLEAYKNEAAAIPMQLQQSAAVRGVTTPVLSAQTNSRLRTNAIGALGVATLMAAAQGRLSTAQSLADRAVAQKYDPILEQIAVAKANLDLILNDPRTKVEEMQRAQVQQAYQDQKAEATQRAMAEESAIWNIATTAAGNAPTFTATTEFPTVAAALQAIQRAGTKQEALAIASKSGLIGGVLLDMVGTSRGGGGGGSGGGGIGDADGSGLPGGGYVPGANPEVDAWARRIRNGTAVNSDVPAKWRDAVTLALDTMGQSEAAKEQVSIIQDKVKLIDDLLVDSGLNSRVGPTWLARRAFAIRDKFGAGQRFAGGVQNLVSKDTLATLLALKAQGGTLGALSDQERILLMNAATKIGAWEIRDENGNGKGEWNIDEKSFKKELQTLRDIAGRALQRAQGGVDRSVVTPEDEAGVSDIYSGNTPGEFDPAKFY